MIGVPDDVRVVLDRVAKDPEFFFSEVLGVRAFPFQIAIAEAVRDHGHVCVPACHASGKDWTTARLALWFNVAFVPSRVVTTAPTDRQVRLVLWEELGEAYKAARYPLGGRLLQQEWKIAEKHGAVGFSTPDYSSDAFAGLHSDHMFVIYDEANGIPAAVRQGGSGLLSGGHVRRLLEIGNPLDPNSEFARSCELRSTKVIRISAFDTPNFAEFGLERVDFENHSWRKKIDDRPLPAPYLITPEWVEEMLDRYGSWTHREVAPRVLGEFPDESADAVFSVDALRRAVGRVFPPREGELRVLGVDVARYGDDKTVIYLGVGPRYRKLDEWDGKSLTQTTNRLIDYARHFRVDEIRVDDDGLGGGVVDGLTEKLPAAKLGNVRVMRMNGGARANDFERYVNRRAEWYDALARAFEDGLLSIEGDEELFAQLRATKIKKWDGKGRIVLLSKDEIKKEIGRSPDEADALVYAFGDPSGYAPLELL